MIKSTAGLKFGMTKAGIVLTDMPVTAITNAKPAVVSVADTSTMKDGDIVMIDGTGMPSIDGKEFMIGSLTATGFELLGSDASADTAATKGIEHYYPGTAYDFFCVNSIDLANNSSSPIAVPTFCNPTGSVAGLAAQAPTLSIGMYLDPDDPGYCKLDQARSDGGLRGFRIDFPGKPSTVLVMYGVVSGVDITDIPLDGAVQITSEIVLSVRPTIWGMCP